MTTSTTPSSAPLRVLVPYDDSANSRRAIEQAIQLVRRGLPFELHLLNVQPSLRSDVTRFVPADSVRSFHHDEGLAVLKSARVLLESAGIPFVEHVHVGEPAAAISAVVASLHADLVLMGTHGRSAVGELLMGSVATGVIRSVHVPVMLVR